MLNDAASSLNSGSGPLTAEEEAVLVRAWREKGDIKARNRLVSAFRGFAYSCARDFSRGRGEIEDLRQEAVMGLMDAASRFDPDLGWRFSTYAAWWIRARISKSLVNGHMPVTVNSGVFRKLYFALNRTLREVERELRTEDGPASPDLVRLEAARRLKVTLEDLERFSPFINLTTRSLDEPVPSRSQDDDGRTLADLVLGSVPPAEQQLADSEAHARLSQLVREAMEKLCARDRAIITARWLEEDDRVTLGELGEKHAISREGIRQIELRAFEKIARHLSREPDFAQLIAIPAEKRAAARTGKCIRKIRKP